MGEFTYPETIQIGGHVHKVILVDGYWTSDDTNSRADYTQGSLEIRFTTRSPGGNLLAETYINECLWHEILHGIDHVYISKLEEDQIERMAQGVVQVLEQLGIRLIRGG